MKEEIIRDHPNIVISLFLYGWSVNDLAVYFSVQPIEIEDILRTEIKNKF